MIDILKQLTPEKDGMYTKITARFLANPEFLKLAYNFIKNKESHLMAGGESQQSNLDRVSQKWFQETANQLKRGTYEFAVNRRINIPKCGSKKSRFLIIGNFKNKIIQKAIHLIFEEIYERKDKIFLKYSHGFRPNRSCHTALEEIKKK